MDCGDEIVGAGCLLNILKRGSLLKCLAQLLLEAAEKYLSYRTIAVRATMRWSIQKTFSLDKKSRVRSVP